MVFGTLLAILGIVLYQLADPKSFTALIPSGFGILLVLMGRLAGMSDKARMHAMHGAALIGLIGLIGGIVMAIRLDPNERPVGFWGNVIMAALSGIFVGLCVKSFIDARKARAAREHTEGPTV